MGPRTFAAVQEPLVLLLSSLWAAHPTHTGFDFIVIAPLLLSRCGFSFVLGHWVCFFGGLHLQCQDGRVKQGALIFWAYLLWSSKELEFWACSCGETCEGPSLQTQWLLPSHTQDAQVMVVRSNKTWSTGEGNGKPLLCSCLENPMKSMKRQKDMTPEDESPVLIGVQ